VDNSLLINLSFLIKNPTGLATYASNLYPRLKSLNPTLLTSQAIADFDLINTPANITSDQGTKGHLRRLLWTQFKLPNVYRHHHARLVFTPIPEAPLFSDCRYVTTAHDLIPLRFGRRFSRLKLYFQLYVPLVLRQAEHILCNSESTANEIMEFFKIPARKITPTPLAYDAQNFRPLQLPTKNYFLYIGRHDAHKNVHGLIAAFAEFAKRSSEHWDYELYIAGPYDDRYTDNLRMQVLELGQGLGQRIKFLDYVPYSDLPKLINQAIALVFPSFWEGFGLPALEAMACGTPVIASNVSALPEVTGDAALLINPYDHREIAAAMSRLVDEHYLRSDLSRASLKRARLFSWDRTAAQTIEVLSRYL
jgi:glycosyltransferase involved in cell wall biosynthesis